MTLTESNNFLSSQEQGQNRALILRAPVTIKYHRMQVNRNERNSYVTVYDQNGNDVHNHTLRVEERNGQKVIFATNADGKCMCKMLLDSRSVSI